MFLFEERMSWIFDYFFFSSRRLHTRLTCDWSSDVCSSDLDSERLAVSTTSPEYLRKRKSSGHSATSESGHNRPRATAANPQQRLDWQLLLSLRQRLCDLTGTLDEKLCDGADRTALQGDD